MPDNIKELFTQDMTMPFMIGMVAQVKTFIIDRAMVALIGTLMAAAGSSSILSYVVYQTQNDMIALKGEMTSLVLSQNTTVNDIGYIRTNLDKLTNSMEKHLEGHPVRIAR